MSAAECDYILEGPTEGVLLVCYHQPPCVLCIVKVSNATSWEMSS